MNPSANFTEKVYSLQLARRRGARGAMNCSIICAGLTYKSDLGCNSMSDTARPFACCTSGSDMYCISPLTAQPFFKAFPLARCIFGVFGRRMTRAGSWLTLLTALPSRKILLCELTEPFVHPWERIWSWNEGISDVRGFFFRHAAEQLTRREMAQLIRTMHRNVLRNLNRSSVPVSSNCRVG